jgi:hypothetical protein
MPAPRPPSSAASADRESAVAGVAGEHDAAGAGGSGDRGRAGVVLAALGVGEPVRVVAELGQNPGAENRAQPGLDVLADLFAS